MPGEIPVNTSGEKPSVEVQIARFNHLCEENMDFIYDCSAEAIYEVQRRLVNRIKPYSSPGNIAMSLKGATEAEVTNVTIAQFMKIFDLSQYRLHYRSDEEVEIIGICYGRHYVEDVGYRYKEGSAGIIAMEGFDQESVEVITELVDDLRGRCVSGELPDLTENLQWIKNDNPTLKD
jgi:hypothetical protein